MDTKEIEVDCTMNDYYCECKKCEPRLKEEVEYRAKNQALHVEHPFYEEVRQYVKVIETQQIMKGAEKYPEPFNPESWTGEELADHAMQENRDQAVYITGMRQKLREVEKISEKLTEFLVTEFPEQSWNIKNNGAIETSMKLLKYYRSVEERGAR